MPTGSQLASISPLAAILTGLGLFGGSSQKTDRKYQLQQMGLLDTMGKTMTGAGTAALQSGTRDMQSIMAQLQKIMGGGQGALEAVAPQVNTVASQYQAGRKAAAEFSPRGGGRTAALADTGFKEMGDIQDMMFKEQGRARGQASSVAAAMADLGLGEVGTGITAAEGVADIAGSHMEFAAKQSEELGQNIGKMLAGFLIPGGGAAAAAGG